MQCQPLVKTIAITSIITASHPPLRFSVHDVGGVLRRHSCDSDVTDVRDVTDGAGDARHKAAGVPQIPARHRRKTGGQLRWR